SVLYKYYDESLQPTRYAETKAPLEAQLYFYIRDPFEEQLFVPKNELDFIRWSGWLLMPALISTFGFWHWWRRR
ncbi:MAG: hypothetical protein QF443_03035, partial [Dehalococcoidia bacterium]|nr:hypothetical protein [Dehalococcoidia bacterium]